MKADNSNDFRSIKLDEISDRMNAEMEYNVMSNKDIIEKHFGDTDTFLDKFRNEMTLSQKYIYLKLLKGYVKSNQKYEDLEPIKRGF